ncbi:MAG: thiamine pyrophosphate-dependent enzyme [Thermoproteota archaeon]
MVNVKDYEYHVKPDWCIGCGNYAQWNSIKAALAELNIEPHNVVIVSGIGCSGNMPEYIRAYGFHGLHGRLLPVASGIKFANPNLTVIAYGGDGDGYYEGLNHLYHTAKRNVDIKYIVSDNEVFGLTTGQASPTAPLGFISKTTPPPEGSIEKPVNPLTLALTAGATFVARGFSGEIKHLQTLIVEAIKHKGFALIDVISPCVTWNKIGTYGYYRERVYKLQGNDPTNFDQAYKLASESKDKIPIGIFYKVEKPTYNELDPILRKGPLVGRKTEIRRELLEEFY